MIKVEEESQLYQFPPQQKTNQPSPLLPQRPYLLERKSKGRRTARGAKTVKGFNSSLWKIEENSAYMWFLVQNYKLFLESSSQRRLKKINVLMSEAVKTRSPDQCRSHHQKMMKFHKDIPSIVDYIRSIRSPQTESHSPQQQLKVEQQEPTM